MKMEGDGCCSCGVCNNDSSENQKKVDKKVYLAAFLVQAMYGGMTLLSKAVFDLGMNSSIFIFYRQTFATAFLIPFAVYFEWRTAPPLPFKTFCWIFLLSFFGITVSFNVYCVALDYTTATLASATTNSVPVITFFLAVLFRMEKWKIKTIPGLAKLGGIVVCIGGVLVLGLYKGFSINPPSISHHFGHHQLTPNQHHGSWMKGFFLMITSNFSFSFWLVMQASAMKLYPSKLLFTTLSTLLSSLQSFVIAISIERNPLEWKLGWNLRLLAVAYCGIIVTGMSYYLQAYVIQKKGPVYLAMWTPLSFVITVIFSSLLLGEIITLGSIIGGILLVGGLYSVLWAKSKETKGLKCTAPQVILASKDTAIAAAGNDLHPQEKEIMKVREADHVVGINHDEDKSSSSSSSPV